MGSINECARESEAMERVDLNSRGRQLGCGSDPKSEDAPATMRKVAAPGCLTREDGREMVVVE
jgi:hypothetical protein